MDQIFSKGVINLFQSNNYTNSEPEIKVLSKEISDEIEESIKEHERGKHSRVNKEYWNSIRKEFGLDSI